MSIFSQWIISIAGVVVLSASVEILMPDGATNKYIKSALAIACMFVLVSPLGKVTNGDISINDIFYRADYAKTSINYSFIEYINGKRMIQVEDDLKNYLYENGFDNVEIKIEAAYINFEVDITFVKVYLQDFVILSNEQNINSSKEIVGLICSYLNIAKEKVLLYGE